MRVTPVCGKCDATTFEVKSFTPRASAYPLMSVQCAACGVPIGVLESFNASAAIEKLATALKVKIN